jgi:hypothetical protein
MDTIYYPTASRQPGDPIPVYVGQAIPWYPSPPGFITPSAHTEDGKQMLIYITGKTVCGSFAGQVVPVFGKRQVCQGEPVTYYTASGMLNYGWSIYDTINGSQVGSDIAQLFSQHPPAGISTQDSVVAVFHKPGKYAIRTRYAPESGELNNTLLNPTYMEIEVTAQPYLAFTDGPSANICFGETIDVGQFVYDTVSGNNTIFYYERIDGSTYTPIGSGDVLMVAPQVTTSYRITAKTANEICESANAVEFTVNVQQPPRLEVVRLWRPTTCEEDLGELILTVTGGSGQYQYSTDDEEYNTFQSNTLYPGYFFIQDLAIGTYTIYVKDDQRTACPAAVSNPITVNANTGFFATAKIDSATHCSSADGRITLAVNGGQYPYTYSLDGDIYSPLQIGRAHV